MIIYFEGLPRSGKSLNCLKDYIVPALAKGRKYYCYIAGLNHEKIARLAGISLERCQELLIPLTKEQAREFHKHVTPDSGIALDEAESMWPARRQPLDEDIRTYIAEHGHYGHDIVLMGQNFNDLHSTWRSRTAQKVFFLKRTAAGKPNEFSTTIYTGIHDGHKTKWQELRHIKGIPYDEEYFGAYASHTDDTTNKETFIDERANVWNNPILRRWLPLYAVFAIFALGYVIYVFKGNGIVNKQPKTPVAAQTRPAPRTVSQPAPMPQPVARPLPNPAPLAQPDQPALKQASMKETGIPTVYPPADPIVTLSQQYRVRLGGFVASQRRNIGFVEWRTESFALVERMTFDQLRGLGWLVLLDAGNNIAFLQKYDLRYIVTAWPLPDPEGKVPQARIDQIRNAGEQGASEPAPMVVSSNDYSAVPEQDERNSRVHLTNGHTKPAN